MLSRLSAGSLVAMTVLCLGLMSGSAFAQGSSLTISDETVDGLATATVSVSLNTDTETEGYVLAIGYDTSALSTMNVVVSSAVAAIGAELVSAEIFEAQGGLTLGVVLDSVAPFDGQTIPVGTTEIANFDGVSDAIVAVPTVVDLVFTDGVFNNPPLDNIVVQGGLSVGQGQGLGLNDGSITINPPPPDSVAIESVTTPSDTPASVRILMNNQSGAVQGYVLSIVHDDAIVDLQDINLSGTVAAAVGAEFVVPSIENGGGTLGVVLDFNPPFDAQTIDVGIDQHIANYVYSCDNVVTFPAGSTPPPSEVASLAFADGVFGSPPLDNVLVVAGLSINPGLIDGTFTCDPVEMALQDTVYACGVLDENGNIVDPQVPLGGDFDLCFFYSDPTDNIQGFQIAVTFDCNLNFIEGTFSIAGTILEAVGAEFVNHSVDNDPNDGDGCELTVGILLDALPPFEGQTVPASADFLQIGCISGNVKIDAPCNTCLPVQYTDFVDADQSIPIENIVVVGNQSIQDFQTLDCNVCTVSQKQFIRGDCNFDIKVDLADAQSVLANQFQGFPVQCLDACDANDDGKVNLADTVFLLNYLFDGGLVPPPPSPSPIASLDDLGTDPTDDDNLSCETGFDTCP